MGWNVMMSCEGRIEKYVLKITFCHYSASLVMPIGDPRDRFFYPNLTLMMDSHRILNQIHVRCHEKIIEDITILASFSLFQIDLKC